jgi:hypothetical protein
MKLKSKLDSEEKELIKEEGYILWYMDINFL